MNVLIVYLLFIYLFLLIVKILDTPLQQTRTSKNDATEDITQTLYLGVRARSILEIDNTDTYPGLSGHFS